METIDFINNTDYEFVELSEQYRIYTFIEEGKEFTVHINEPRRLHVSESGGHRIFAADGTSHYVPAKWIHLSWKSTEGKSHFCY